MILDNLFFILSKIVWILASPGNMLYIFLLFILFFVWRGNTKLVNRSLFIFLSIISLITFIPIGNHLLKPLEQAYPISPKIPDNLTGIILLGGAIDARAINKNLKLLFFINEFTIGLNLLMSIPEPGKTSVLSILTKWELTKRSLSCLFW